MSKMVNFCLGLAGVWKPLSWLIFMHRIPRDLKEARDIHQLILHMRELKPDVTLTPRVTWLIRTGSETQDFCHPILTRVISHHSSNWGMYKGQSFEDSRGLPWKGKRHSPSWK